MLDKLNRLRKNSDFAKTFKNGKGIFVGKLSLKVAGSPRSKVCRFGFVISNKIEQRATRRNALKRRLRAATREFQSQIAGTADVVVVVKQNYAWPYDYTEIKGDLEKGLRQAGLLNS